MSHGRNKLKDGPLHVPCTDGRVPGLVESLFFVMGGMKSRGVFRSVEEVDMIFPSVKLVYERQLKEKSFPSKSDSPVRVWCRPPRGCGIGRYTRTVHCGEGPQDRKRKSFTPLSTRIVSNDTPLSTYDSGADHESNTILPVLTIDDLSKTVPSSK